MGNNDSKKMVSDLEKLDDALKRSGEERRMATESFNKSIREPDKFIEDEDEELAKKGFGVGFWRVPGGLLIMRRWANGYHSNQYEFIGNKNLKMYLRLAKKAPKKLMIKKGSDNDIRK